jgi:hypothetical protein
MRNPFEAVAVVERQTAFSIWCDVLGLQIDSAEILQHFSGGSGF